MKVSKLLLQAILVAVTTATITSCEKQKIEKPRKTAVEKQNTDSVWVNCPACGMG